ncbi:HAMP domain-containing sensor histidine kinase [Bdellovibrionota bacterium FG-2]
MEWFRKKAGRLSVRARLFIVFALFSSLAYSFSFFIIARQKESALIHSQMSEREYSIIEQSYPAESGEGVRKALRAIRESDQNFLKLYETQQKSAFLHLALFLAIILLAYTKIITLLTRSISHIAHFLDGINCEAPLPERIPFVSKSEAPEIQSVISSINKFLLRLRVFQAINVKRLISEKSRADVIASSVAHGVFLFKEKRLIYMNDIARQILDLRPGREGVGSPFDELQTQVESREGWNKVSAVLQGNHRVLLKIEDDSARVYYELRAVPVEAPLGDGLWKGLLSDADLQRWATRDQADTVVLAQDVTLVHEYQEARGHFLAMLSHEAKTPVTTLTMATRLLARRIDEFEDQTLRSLITTSVREVDRLRALLDNLLSVTTLNELSSQLELREVDIGKLVRYATDSFRDMAHERGVQMALEVVGETPACSGIMKLDPTRVSWAFCNIMTNAIRHTPRGGVVTTMVVYSEGRVEVRVKDSGPGVEFKRQLHLFEKFKPHYDMRVGRSGGVGAGLATARELVEAHGGRIWVRSEPGKGAEFCFAIPRVGLINFQAVENMECKSS